MDSATRKQPQQQAFTRTINLQGLPNPEPILRLAQAAQSWDDGDIVRVLSDDPCFANDLLRWAGGTELQVVSLRYPTRELTEVVLRRPTVLQHRISA